MSSEVHYERGHARGSRPRPKIRVVLFARTEAMTDDDAPRPLFAFRGQIEVGRKLYVVIGRKTNPLSFYYQCFSLCWGMSESRLRRREAHPQQPHLVLQRLG